MQKKNNIVHVITGLKVGGAEAVLLDLVRGTPEYEHHVIYFHSGPHVQSLKKLGIATHHIKGIVCLYDPFFWFRFMRRVVSLKPDLLHGSLWAANYAVRIVGLLFKVPTMCAIHAHADINGKIRRFFDRHSPQPDRFIVVSDAVKRSCIEQESWMSAKKMVTIRDGIDIERVQAFCSKQKQNRATYNLASEHFVIGAVGRFASEKNFFLLIDAFAQVHAKYSHARLLLVGYGEHEQLLRKRVADYGLVDSVIFVIGKSSYGYYSLMNCFVVPSKSESLSLALLEAMLCGIPSILSAMAYEHDILIHNKNGLLVANNDSVTFANTIISLMQDSKLQACLGQEAQKTVIETCDSATMIRGYQKIYGELLKQQRPTE